MRPTSLHALLCLLCLLVLATAGCVSWGFQKYDPGAISLYDEMLVEVVNQYDAEHWFWVRGRIGADLDRNGKDEDVVLATLHTGTRQSPSPILAAILLICEPRKNLSPKLLRRLVVYTASKTEAATALPWQVHAPLPQASMQEIGAKAFVMEDDGLPLLMISLGSAPIDGRILAYHAGYEWSDGGAPHLRFASLALQSDLAIDAMDMDRDGRDELLLPHAPLDPMIVPGVSAETLPQWHSVFVRKPDATYALKSEPSPRAYAPLLLPWYEEYARALQDGADRQSVLVREYYIGLAHHYNGEPEKARRFLTRVRDGGDDRLARLARTILEPAGSPADGPTLPADRPHSPSPADP